MTYVYWILFTLALMSLPKFRKYINRNHFNEKWLCFNTFCVFNVVTPFVRVAKSAKLSICCRQLRVRLRIFDEVELSSPASCESMQHLSLSILNWFEKCALLTILMTAIQKLKVPFARLRSTRRQELKLIHFFCLLE